METGSSTAPAWIALGGTALGVVIGFAGQFFATRATSERERESRREARHDAAVQKRNEFQRDTLLRLQVLAADVYKTANAMGTHTRQVEITTGAWATHYPDELLDRVENSCADLDCFLSRVLDDETRKSGMHFRSCFVNVFQATEEQSFRAGMVTFWSAYIRFVDAVGQSVRLLEQDLVTP